MSQWSTDAVMPRERFSYWREAVCRSIFNVSIEAPPGAFSARMESRSWGPVRVAMGESSSYLCVRNRRDVESAPADHYSIYMPLRGKTVISQCQESLTFAPNDIAISDLRHPFTAALDDGGCRITTVIPFAMIDRRAPWVRRTVLRRLAAGSPFVDLARRHILELCKADLTESAGALLTDNLCNLLALASADEITPSRLQPDLQITAMLAFCRQHLHDAELTPQQVADRLGVSVRTVHSRFKQLGQSFGRWLLEERLNACRGALRDQSQRGANISEIAYRWGFNDLSHFNKAFRARFDQTPREWRNGADN